jgi:stage V sporulation protein SpoVS
MLATSAALQQQQQRDLQQAPQQQQQQQGPGSPDLSSPSDDRTAGAAEGSGDGSSNSNRLPESPDGPDIVKVSHRSRVSSVAGKIAHDVRDGRLPRIMVAGNPSISVATKAIVQARRYLRPEGQDIAFAPLFRSSDHSRALLELAIVLMPLERGTAANNLAQLDNAGGHEVRIASSSRHARVGSSTARQLRARGINVLCSVGQEALANSVMATAHAACYLADVGRQMVVQPSHVVLQRGSQELHSFKLVVMFA